MLNYFCFLFSVSVCHTLSLVPSPHSTWCMLSFLRNKVELETIKHENVVVFTDTVEHPSLLTREWEEELFYNVYSGLWVPLLLKKWLLHIERFNVICVDTVLWSFEQIILLCKCGKKELRNIRRIRFQSLLTLTILCIGEKAYDILSNCKILWSGDIAIIFMLLIFCFKFWADFWNHNRKPFLRGISVFRSPDVLAFI